MRGAFLIMLAGCVGDSTAVDAGNDANVPDTGAPETSADANADAGSSFCTGTNYAFCADFDLVASPEIGWSGGKSEKLGGTATLDQTSYVSPPFALSSKLPAITGGTVYTYAGAVSHVIDLKGNKTTRLQYDAYPKGPSGWLFGDCLVYTGLQLNGVGGIIIMQRRTSDAGPTEWLVYRTLTTSSSPHLMTSGLSLSKWSHVVQEVTWANDTTGTIHVSIDNVTTLDLPAIKTTEEAQLQTVRVTVGLTNCSASAQASAVSFDNVFVELVP